MHPAQHGSLLVVFQRETLGLGQDRPKAMVQAQGLRATGLLLGVEAPAILAEVSALSNPDEESRLNTDAHREALAQALEEGIVAYLDARPLTRTPLAHAPTPKTNHGRQEEDHENR